jgi:hypothetical protein
MSENLTQECLFIGGSADGMRIRVDTSLFEQPISSESHLPKLHSETPEEALADGNPVPPETTVYEIYERLDVENDGEEITVYALNSMTPEMIDVQLTKHFGETESSSAM